MKGGHIEGSHRGGHIDGVAQRGSHRGGRTPLKAAGPRQNRQLRKLRRRRLTQETDDYIRVLAITRIAALEVYVAVFRAHGIAKLAIQPPSRLAMIPNRARLPGSGREALAPRRRKKKEPKGRGGPNSRPLVMSGRSGHEAIKRS